MSNNSDPDPESREGSRKPAPIEIPLEKVLSPLEKFASSQATAGIVLLFAVILALAMANSAYRDIYLVLNHLPLGISLGEWSLKMSVHHWVNEGLMVLFFFVLGLEIKREFLVGDLQDPRRSILVLLMALGGMLLPAAIYMLVILLSGEPATGGWGIAMATDTAFALGILGMLGTRAPAAMTLMLSALAILDDVGAVLVISTFYSEDINQAALLRAAIAFSILGFFNLAGVRRPFYYLLGGLLLWWNILHSGIHVTTTGILVAFMVPSRPYAGTSWFQYHMSKILRRFNEIDDPGQTILEQHRQHDLAQQAKDIAVKTTTPLQRWENSLDKPVTLAVLPLFAFLNAGVELSLESGINAPAPVTLAVASGLVIGKALGISGFAWLGLQTGWCRLPGGVKFVHILALGLLAGIGFTMSLFITTLAFEGQPQLMNEAKLGILGGSLLAGILGIILFLTNPTSESPERSTDDESVAAAR